ncbi:MAG: hypothetical protein ACI85U_003641 [Candidatus Promineifilaceae bacterium]|jgi:hypothetical protein
MKSILNRKFVVLSALLLTFLMPLSAFAADDPASANVGLGVTLGLIALILIILGVVAVIGAVSLGIIGIGYALSNAE